MLVRKHHRSPAFTRGHQLSGKRPAAVEGRELTCSSSSPVHDHMQAHAIEEQQRGRSDEERCARRAGAAPARGAAACQCARMCHLLRIGLPDGPSLRRRRRYMCPCAPSTPMRCRDTLSPSGICSTWHHLQHTEFPLLDPALCPGSYVFELTTSRPAQSAGEQHKRIQCAYACAKQSSPNRESAAQACSVWRPAPAAVPQRARRPVLHVRAQP